VEILWASGDSSLRIADLIGKPVRWFGFDTDNHPRFRSAGNPWLGEELPFGKFVFARHFPTYDNPYGLRLLSRCFWPAAFKKGGIKFWVTLAEKYGMPFMLGK
jgi:phage gp29-like protein